MIKFFKNFSFKELLYNRKLVIALSIVTAFIFWLVITISEAPTKEKTVNMTVNISVSDTIVGDLGLDIVSGGIGQKIAVKVSGPSYILAEINENDINISPELSEVNKPGVYTIRLNASRASSTAGYEFVSVTPSTLDVRFDYMDTKQFTVIPAVSGAVASEGLIAEEPTVTSTEQSTITVKGPRTEMSKLASVKAFAEVNKTLSKTESFDAAVQLLDKDGRQLDSSLFTLSYDTVKVSVPISKKKTVAIKATFINAPSGIGKDITYTLSETEVSVIGSPDIIDSLTEIELAPLDFREISHNTTTFEAQFDLPDGIRLIDSIEFVTVEFNFKNFSQYTFTIENVDKMNLGSGLTATVTGAVKNVKICGPYAQLRNLKASDFTAQIELLGKTAGEYTVPVKVYCKTSSSVWQYGEYSAVVVIK